MMQSYDVIIVGAGIIGLTHARALKKAGVNSVAVLEKESTLGVHASGRNSGVLHAGFYYTSQSLKAKHCAEGSRRLYEYAAEHGIDARRCGKVVVAPTADDVPQLQVLLDRAAVNGIELKRISLAELKEIEPEAYSVDSALFSPNTGVIDSKAVLKALQEELKGMGVPIYLNSEVLEVRKNELKTRSGNYGYRYLVNSAGLYADRIAHACGAGKRYRILPFKGLYRKLHDTAASRFRSLIYPVPDLRLPFLGVHVTRSIYDTVSLGPTAIPALGRENYGMFSGMQAGEGFRMAATLAGMTFNNTQGMRQLIREELPRYTTGGLLKAAQRIAPSLARGDLSSEGKVGIRAQLFDVEKQQLEMDFVVEDAENSTHILNAISPAFSASFAFSEWIVKERILPRL